MMAVVMAVGVAVPMAMSAVPRRLHGLAAPATADDAASVAVVVAVGVVVVAVVRVERVSDYVHHAQGQLRRVR
jgi:hypothetical protein